MLAMQNADVIDLEQGSPEWFEFRKRHITATDACIITGASHWKTRIQLYYEKLSNDPPMPPNERMKRGLDLEPIARDLFNVKTGLNMKPAVLVNDWLMASLDGLDADMGCLVEIKCPGEKDHSTAVSGKVPDHYYPQLQHQMYVANVQTGYYFSFDGMDGVIVDVKRDDDYITKMLGMERSFYECLINKQPPEPIEGDYIEREDSLWQECAKRWKNIKAAIMQMESEEEETRKQLIFLSGESNTKGGGISLCHVQRKGLVQYGKIPQLKGVDLDQYRNASTTSWRITCT